MSSHCSHEAIEMSNVTIRASSSNDIRACKNAESPFLRLPLEVKTRIYEFVCGGQTIHIVSNLALSRRVFLSHYLCCEELSEEETQEKFDTSQAAWYAPETADRHEHCAAHSVSNFQSSTYSPDRKPCRLLTEKFETNVLHCCRQMYLESRFVPYYANTFCFDSAKALNQFCREIPEQYRAAIRSLQVELRVSVGGGEYKHKWNIAFHTVTTSLKHLQRLYINIELLASEHSPYLYDEMPAEKSVLGHILQAGKLDLKIATVVLWDSHFTDEWAETMWSKDAEDERETQERWTLEQKQEWSRYLRKALLHYEDRSSDLAKLKQEALEQGRVCRLEGAFSG